MKTKPFLFTLFLVVSAALLVGCDRRTVTADQLAGKHVAIMITEGFQDEETLHPMDYLSSRGAKVTVIGPSTETVKAYNSDVTVQIEKTVASVSVHEFDALVIPGGRSPGALRKDGTAVAFAEAFVKSGKPVAAICHGPQVLITAGVMHGKRATAVAAISNELEEAGSHYEDSPLVRDGNIITSRLPKDLPVFSEAIAEALTETSIPLTPSPVPLFPAEPAIPPDLPME